MFLSHEFGADFFSHRVELRRAGAPESSPVQDARWAQPCSNISPSLFSRCGRFLRLQYKYTGIPAAKIMRPNALFAGYVQMVLATMAAQERTKMAVV